MSSTTKYPFYVQLTVILLLVTLVVHGLIAARDFLYPVALGMLFAGLLYPAVAFLEKRKFPRSLAILLSILVGIIVIGGIAYFVITQISVFAEGVDQIKERATENFNSVTTWAAHTLGVKINTQQLPINNLNGILGDVLTATTGTLVKIGLQPVYVFFFLFYRDKFSRFLCRIVPAHKHENLDEIMHEFTLVAKNYVGGLFIVVLILCVINSAGLYLIGLKYALLFGILSAIANFIPYFGTLIGGCFPLAYALLAHDPSKALYVVLLFIFVQFLENNILTPRITGGYVNINPIITILGIITGGMIWGIPGMFLSVPALAIAKSICSHIDALKPVAYLLERNTKT